MIHIKLMLSKQEEHRFLLIPLMGVASHSTTRQLGKPPSCAHPIKKVQINTSRLHIMAKLRSIRCVTSICERTAKKTSHVPHRWDSHQKVSKSPPQKRKTTFPGSRSHKLLSFEASQGSKRPLYTIHIDGMIIDVEDTAHLDRIFDNFNGNQVVNLLCVNSNVPKRLDTVADMIPYIEALNRTSDLRVPSFSGVSLGIWSCYALADCLRLVKTIEAANFSDVFTGRLTTEIAPALDALVSDFLELPNLQAIELSDNALGPNVQWPLVRLLSVHTPLVNVHLNNVGFGPETGVAVAEALAKLACNKTRANGPPLTVFACDRNHLVEDEESPERGMAAWARALRAHGNLRVVSLSNNGFRKGGVDILLREGLRLLSDLRSLNLEDDTFSSRGQTHTALADAVQWWPWLTEFNNNDSLLGSRGATLLIEALKRTEITALQVLKMHGNNFSASNLEALVEAFEELRGLCHIEIADDNVSGDDLGYRTLKSLLEQRSHNGKTHCSIDDMDEEASSQSSLVDGW